MTLIYQGSVTVEKTLRKYLLVIMLSGIKHVMINAIHLMLQEQEKKRLKDCSSEVEKKLPSPTKHNLRGSSCTVQI